MNRPILSTRSNKNSDAHRDFDNFDVDEELRRFREALRTGQVQTAAVLAANLDEHLTRGGPLPVAWLGPSCMQEDSDIRARHQEALERARAMTSDRLWDAQTYVRIPVAVQEAR